ARRLRALRGAARARDRAGRRLPATGRGPGVLSTLRLAADELVSKPGAGLEPFALRRPDRQAEGERGFVVGQAREIPAFDHGGQTTIRLGELAERQIDLEDPHGVVGGRIARLVERHRGLVAAALLAGAPAGMVDHDLADGDRADRE